MAAIHTVKRMRERYKSTLADSESLLLSLQFRENEIARTRVDPDDGRYLTPDEARKTLVVLRRAITLAKKILANRRKAIDTADALIDSLEHRASSRALRIRKRLGR